MISWPVLTIEEFLFSDSDEDRGMRGRRRRGLEISQVIWISGKHRTLFSVTFHLHQVNTLISGSQGFINNRII